ncbi:DUF2809 domain-containing protein [Streptomyces fagopyri]|uniref:DUF2809 domain-containing protein n=1 Tax=Streptomyces fagopyri TaxID=2662397 RepID=A0A5Q0L5H2_9ACTN|nr:DUF2809 domain-containing protein [Streptomyces fagopyri]QFZ72024.1 DUF2809 domain-containing protein [Streptomyces fagopyri]
MNRRWWAFGAAGVTVAAGLGVRSWTGGDFAKYTGDALYTVLACAVVVTMAPRLRPAVAAGVALGFSWAVELSQIAGIPTVLQPLFGATFNAPDLFWYVVGAVLGWLLARGGWRRGVEQPADPGRRQRVRISD